MTFTTTTETTCDVCRRRMRVRTDVPNVKRTCGRGACTRARHAAYVAAWRQGRPLGPIAPAVGARAALCALAAELLDTDVRELVLRAADRVSLAAA